MSSAVSHPAHYNAGKFEVIEIIEDQQPDFHLGNALKYICRAGKKDPAKTIEDLEKAIWYVQRKIALLKAEKGEALPRPNDMNPRAESLAPGACSCGYCGRPLPLAGSVCANPDCFIRGGDR